MSELRHTAAREACWVVVDFETTGAVPGYAVEPWQIGWVLVRQGRVCAEEAYETYLRIDAGRPFNPRAPGRHAALRDQLATAPTPGEVWPVWASRLVGRPLVAHNVGTERTLLTRLAPLHRLGPWADTLTLLRRVYPDLASKALDGAVAALGLEARVRGLCPGREAHDALYDAFACAVLLEHVLGLPGWECVTVGALTEQGGGRVEYWNEGTLER